MPKNKKGGKKKKKAAGSGSLAKRQLELAEDMQEYAKILKCMGDRKLNVVLTDSSQMVASIPGRFRKRVWMAAGDIIIASRRDFQDSKLDVIYKYTKDEVRKLHKQGLIPDFFLDENAKREEPNDTGVYIDNESDDDDLPKVQGQKSYDISDELPSESSSASSSEESDLDIDDI